MKKRTARILTALAVLIVVLGVAYAIAVAVSAARLRRVYAEIEKAGSPMQAADVIPPGIPDSENAALLYESAILLLKAQPAEGGDVLSDAGRLSNSFLHGSIEPNGLADLEMLMSRDVVSQALSIMQQGTRRPGCRFERDYDRGLQMKLLLGDLRSMVRLLSARARLEARSGRPAAAWEIARTQLRFADSLRQEPVLISQLVRSAMIRLSCETIQEVSGVSPPDKQQTEDLAGFLKTLDDVRPMVLATDGERLLVGEWLFNMPVYELRTVLRKEMFANDNMPGVFYWALFHRIAFRPSFLADHAAYLKALHESSRLLKSPYSRNDSEEQLPGKHRLTNMLMPAVRRIREIHLETTAQVRITLAGLALLQYKQAHGVFPPTLDALDVKGLADPFIDQPLRYRAEGEGFVLYSLGADQKDNGGSPKQPKQKTDFDIVWQFPGGK